MHARDLKEIEAIKQLKARYFRCLDLKRWDEFTDVFTEDACLDVGDDVPGLVVTGRANIVAMVRGAVGSAVTVHHGHMPEIEIVGPDQARGIWAMEDHLEFPGEPPSVVDGRGHYHEEYERGADGAWRITSLRLVRLLLVHDGRRIVPRGAGSAA